MTAAVYLDGEPSESITTLTLTHLLKYMIIELFGGIQQLPEKMACPTVLIGKKSGYRLGPKRLMEKAPVESPTIAVRHKNGTETQTTP